METIFTSVKERILQFTDFKGFAKEKFFSDLGVTYGNFKGAAKEKSLSSDVLAKIVSNYPEINPLWLLTGKGKMIVDENNIVSEPTVTYKSANTSEKRYPLVSSGAVVGLFNSDFKIEDRHVKDWYVIPKFRYKKIDFMIEVEESSMYPKYNSGDVVACRLINERQFIQWNKTHVIVSKNQGLLIKRIKESEKENSLMMISDNKDYPCFNLPISDIDVIALVVGLIRME